MESGTIPKNWEKLVKYSSKMATSQYVDLSYTWMQGQSNKGASDLISDTFANVTDHHKRQKTNTSGSASANKDIPISASEGYTWHKAISPTSQPMDKSADKSFANSQSVSTISHM